MTKSERTKHGHIQSGLVCPEVHAVAVAPEDGPHSDALKRPLIGIVRASIAEPTRQFHPTAQKANYVAHERPLADE